MDNSNKYYTAEEVAEILKVTTESVRRWIRDGKLKSVKLGGKYIRVSQADLDEFVLSMRGDNNNG
jgi:excisionase family DNA binding protein